MTKQEVFEKFKINSLDKGEYLVFLCESEGVVILNINDILKVDEEYGETIIRSNRNYYPHPDTITYINV